MRLYNGMRIRTRKAEIWCAGKVPVGATGTIYTFQWGELPHQTMFGIQFDNPHAIAEKNPRFKFGIEQDQNDLIEEV